MGSPNLECRECGKVFKSRDALRKHARIEHRQEPDFVKPQGFSLSHLFDAEKAAKGLALGFVLAAVTFGLYASLFAPQPVEVTVVTCDNCSYGEFRNTTGELFEVEYREVSYDSEEGQKLIERYGIGYVPAFIFDRSVSEKENFAKINSTLKEFEDTYVLPDGRMPAAQRVSSGGFELE